MSMQGVQRSRKRCGVSLWQIQKGGKMTDNEIIKALENEIHLVKYIDGYSACHDDTGSCDYDIKSNDCKFNRKVKRNEHD